METLLHTNAYMLGRNDNSAEFSAKGVRVVPPCYIGKNAKIYGCKIGPYVTIGDDCELSGVEISNSVVWSGVKITNGKICNSIVHK